MVQHVLEFFIVWKDSVAVTSQTPFHSSLPLTQASQSDSPSENNNSELPVNIDSQSSDQSNSQSSLPELSSTSINFDSQSSDQSNSHLSLPNTLSTSKLALSQTINSQTVLQHSKVTSSLREQLDSIGETATNSQSCLTTFSQLSSRVFETYEDMSQCVQTTVLQENFDVYNAGDNGNCATLCIADYFLSYDFDSLSSDDLWKTDAQQIRERIATYLNEEVVNGKFWEEKDLIAAATLCDVHLAIFQFRKKQPMIFSFIPAGTTMTEVETVVHISSPDFRSGKTYYLFIELRMDSSTSMRSLSITFTKFEREKACRISHFRN